MKGKANKRKNQITKIRRGSSKCKQVTITETKSGFVLNTPAKLLLKQNQALC